MTKRLRTWLRHRFLIPRETQSEEVTLPRLVLIRLRWLVVIGWVLAALLLWALIQQNHRDAQVTTVITLAAKLGEAAQSLDALYAEQWAGLAEAHDLYQQAQHTGDKVSRQALYARYTRALERFNQRAEQAQTIRNRLAQLATELAQNFPVEGE